MSAEKPVEKIGEILVRSGMVNQEQLNQALELSRNEGLRIGEALIRLGVLDQDRLTWALGVQFDLSYIDIQPEMVDWDFLLEAPLDRLVELRCLPISRFGNIVVAVVADPASEGLAASIAELFPYDSVVVQLGAEEAILENLARAKRLMDHEEEPGTEVRRIAEASGQGRDLLKLIDSGESERVLVLKNNDTGQRLVYTNDADPGEAGDFSTMDRARLFEMLESRFILESALPGGFCGIRRGARDAGRRTIRAVSLGSLNGWLVSLEAIPHEPPAGSFPTVGVLYGDMAPMIKSATLQTLAETLGPKGNEDSRRPPMVLEGRIDFLAEGLFQSEIPDPMLRICVTRHLLSAARPPVMVLELDTLEEVAHLGLSFRMNPPVPPLLIFLRQPLARPTQQNIPSYVEIMNTTGAPDEIERLLDGMLKEAVR